MWQKHIGSVPCTGRDSARSIEESGVAIRMLGIEKSCALSIRFFIVLASHRLLTRRKLPVLASHRECEAIACGYDDAQGVLEVHVDFIKLSGRHWLSR